jgi:hypothetical protein
MNTSRQSREEPRPEAVRCPPEVRHLLPLADDQPDARAFLPRALGEALAHVRQVGGEHDEAARAEEHDAGEPLAVESAEEAALGGAVGLGQRAVVDLRGEEDVAQAVRGQERVGGLAVAGGQGLEHRRDST